MIKIDAEDYSVLFEKIAKTNLSYVLDNEKFSAVKLLKAIESSDITNLGCAQALKYTSGKIDLTTASIRRFISLSLVIVSTS